MKCTHCRELTGVYKNDKDICARCREVLKVDMAYVLSGMDPVYLSEGNRNKKGRKSKLTANQQSDIFYRHQRGETMGELAKEYNVSKSTVWNIIHSGRF